MRTVNELLRNPHLINCIRDEDELQAVFDQAWDMRFEAEQAARQAKTQHTPLYRKFMREINDLISKVEAAIADLQQVYAELNYA